MQGNELIHRMGDQRSRLGRRLNRFTVCGIRVPGSNVRLHVDKLGVTCPTCKESFDANR